MHFLDRAGHRCMPDNNHQLIHPALKPVFGTSDQGRRHHRPDSSPAGPGSLPVRPMLQGLPISSLSPSMNVFSTTGSLAISTSGASSGMLSPFFPYPGLLAASEEFKYLSMAQFHAANQAHFVGELTKLKQPMLTKNYLELAMLVCNTFRGKLFPCPHCRYVTDRRNNLKRHVATMHQACDKQLECCGVTFATKASLREHITIFHHNGYSCPFCGRRFCRKALLKRHLSVHSGQKDYTCPHCDYATSHKSNLERHKRIHARLQMMGESGLEDIHMEVGAMFSENGLNIAESTNLRGMGGQRDISHSHQWNETFRNDDQVRDVMGHSDDPEDCEVDIDDESDDDGFEYHDVSGALKKDDTGADQHFAASRSERPDQHYAAPRSERPINLVIESNTRASAAAQLAARLTHGFAVPFKEGNMKHNHK